MLAPGWPLCTALFCKYVDYVVEIKWNEVISTHRIVCYDPLPHRDVDSFHQQCTQTVLVATFGRKSPVAEIPLDRTAARRIIR